MLKKRERERGSHFGSSAAPLLGGLCCPLASGGSWGVNLDCASRGAFPVSPAVLEATRPLPRCLRGPAQHFTSPEPDRGPPSGGGPPVGGRGILFACGPPSDLLDYLYHSYFDDKLLDRPQHYRGRRKKGEAQSQTPHCKARQRTLHGKTSAKLAKHQAKKHKRRNKKDKKTRKGGDAGQT